MEQFAPSLDVAGYIFKGKDKEQDEPPPPADLSAKRLQDLLQRRTHKQKHIEKSEERVKEAREALEAQRHFDAELALSKVHQDTLGQIEFYIKEAQSKPVLLEPPTGPEKVDPARELEMPEVMDKAVREYAGRCGLDAAGLWQAASGKKEELQKQLPKPFAACAAFPPVSEDMQKWAVKAKADVVYSGELTSGAREVDFFARSRVLTPFVSAIKGFAGAPARSHLPVGLLLKKVSQWRGVIHRDIKPENVLVVRSSPHPESGSSLLDVKIADFGLSKVVRDGVSLAKTFVGTPQYWAPEVLDVQERGGTYGPAADLWGLGVVLFVMLCGRYPFDGHDKPMQDQIRAASFNTKTSRWRSISAEAKDLVRGVLRVSPSERLRLEGCFCHPWNYCPHTRPWSAAAGARGRCRGPSDAGGPGAPAAARRGRRAPRPGRGGSGAGQEVWSDERAPIPTVGTEGAPGACCR
ncbi:unnamed protein product, partial [Prorocentrum cordatum]